MIGIFLTLLGLPLLVLSAVICQVLVYFWDSKNLRRFPQLHPLSGISNLPFMLESIKGFRSETLHELHHKRGHPVIRTGPNSLSYGSVDAVKVCRLQNGHESPLTKALGYLWSQHPDLQGQTIH
jgi:hypothetical protein